MADNMETDTFSGFKRRIEETPLHHFHQDASASSFTPQESRESSDITVKEDHSTSAGSSFEGNSVEVEETESCEVGCVVKTLNDGEKSRLSSLVGKEDQDCVKVEDFDKHNQEVGSVLEVDCKENLPTSPVVGGESNGESQALLETEKSRVLTELEHGTIFVHKDGVVRPSLKIEVIDDTALIEYVPPPKADVGTEVGTIEKMGWKGKKEEKKQDVPVDGKKVKRSRRKAKDAKRAERLKNFVEDQDGGFKNGEEGSRKMYSRQEMQALRFVDIVQQRNLWRAIYTGLGVVVSNEYDELANSKLKNTPVHFDPRQRFPRKLDAPGILSKSFHMPAPGYLSVNTLVSFHDGILLFISCIVS